MKRASIWVTAGTLRDLQMGDFAIERHDDEDVSKLGLVHIDTPAWLTEYRNRAPPYNPTMATRLRWLRAAVERGATPGAIEGAFALQGLDAVRALGARSP